MMILSGFESIETIFFDLGFTLINFEGDFYQMMAESYLVLANSLVKSGCTFNPVEFSARFNEVISDYYKAREVDLVERPIEGYLQQVLAEYNQPDLTEEVIQEGLTDMYKVTQAYWQLEADSIPTLENLRSLGFHLGIITNAANSADVNYLIDKNGLRRFFKVILISAEEKIRKPDVQIFNRALTRIKSSPSRAIMVGDTLNADIRGAQNAGMKGVWLPRRSRQWTDPAAMDAIKPDLVIESLSELPDTLR